ncbi:hypothetical protein [Acetanaerobacterium elongatum]|uniref:Uncharacterized protein n=1 Tax=Acetanaerobacterium elongatum TaxID=258515 RepID=A0A1H0DT97_9FIRM|nr:hypothetical protein [Acetanaerobacterium elongatum]SDN73266.1 hypothetical protein SAMN05192585_13015 [Acetanaerobacterium elongatum]
MKLNKQSPFRQAALLLAVLICALPLLFSCGDGSVDHVNGQNKRGQFSSDFPPPLTSGPPFTLPFTISRNFVQLTDGTTVYINVDMIEGEYYDKNSPGYAPGDGIYDTNYNGKYQISVYTAIDQPKAVFTMPVTFERGKLNFDKQFQLVFDDYNGDGSPDFTIGQWGSGKGNVYQIYTVTPNAEIKQLPCDTLSTTSFDYSVQLKKASSNSFSCEAYDEKTNKTVIRTYNWQNDRFVLQLP